MGPVSFLAAFFKGKTCHEKHSIPPTESPGFASGWNSAASPGAKIEVAYETGEIKGDQHPDSGGCISKQDAQIHQALEAWRHSSAAPSSK
jgi:hypothetical protein